MSLFKSCHKCAQPYDDCKCDMFKTKLCKKCGNPEEDLGYCCNESQRNEPTPTEVENDGVFIQRVKVGDLEATSKCEPVNTIKIPQYNANEHELNFVESRKEDWVDLGSHYHVGGIEPFDVIEDMGDLESFCRGNAVKYLMRYKHKGTPVQDLEKAKVYIDKLIEIES